MPASVDAGETGRIAAPRPGPESAGLLARVVRGALVESEHRGHLVVLGPSGDVRALVGTPDAVVWVRSSLKPLQAVAMLRAGLEVDDAALALVCASHGGTAEHLAVVRGILTGAGLSVVDLQNTPDVPLDGEAAFAWRSTGGVPSSVTQNCSGKHAGMLATCVAAGWDTSSYLDPGHPLQLAVREVVEDLTGVPVEHVTVDGCGAPLPSTTVAGLARAFGRIAQAPSRAPRSAEARVALAMSRHPRLVGGPGRDVTDLMEAVGGLVAKDGAEGVYAAGLADGSAVAFKVADGSARPRAAVLAAALGLLLDDPAARDRVLAVGRTPVLGHGKPVGEVVAVLGPASQGSGAAGGAA